MISCVLEQWDNVQPADIDIANANDPSRISKEALAKAQRMAAIHAQITNQMRAIGQLPVLGLPGAAPGAGLPALVAGPQGLAALMRRETFKPAPLILDEKGRHVDAEGKEVSLKASAVSVLKANQRESRHIPILQPAVTRDAPVVDPRMSVPSGDRKKRATFAFVEDQRYIRKAERFRNKMAVAEFNMQLKRMKEDRGQEAEKETLAQINLALLKKKQARPGPARRERPRPWEPRRARTHTQGGLAGCRAALPAPPSTSFGSSSALPPRIQLAPSPPPRPRRSPGPYGGGVTRRHAASLPPARGTPWGAGAGSR